MCLRLFFLLITRMASWLRLSRREEAWKTAEILILRHQLAVLQRRQPRRPNLDWADRALLAALLTVIPKAQRQALRLLITPDTVLRWHRDIVRRRWAARSRRGRTGRPATSRTIKTLVLRLAPREPRLGLPQNPRRAGRPGSENSSVDGMGNLEHGQRIPPGRMTWTRFSARTGCNRCQVPVVPTVSALLSVTRHPWGWPVTTSSVNVVQPELNHPGAPEGYHCVMASAMSVPAS